ncbi:unnamed protein product [Clavelina lepadiformis]|uniref:Uncharacterized protein n=1 Tax=Clavelina lepadiformis TaxID=159417 RepID=A0ABP0FAY7_CLALP
MLTTLDNKCNSNVERQCRKNEDPSSEKELNLILRSQKQLWPIHKTNLYDAMQTVNAFRNSLNFRKKTLPSLLVSYNEAGTMKTFIVADSIHVRCNNDSRVVLGYLMQFIGCYYCLLFYYLSVVTHGCRKRKRREAIAPFSFFIFQNDIQKVPFYRILPLAKNNSGARDCTCLVSVALL